MERVRRQVQIICIHGVYSFCDDVARGTFNKLGVFTLDIQFTLECLCSELQPMQIRMNSLFTIR